MAIGVNLPCRQAAPSHGAPHTQPQVEAKGLVSREIKACSYYPGNGTDIATRTVRTGQANWQEIVC